MARDRHRAARRDDRVGDTRHREGGENVTVSATLEFRFAKKMTDTADAARQTVRGATARNVELSRLFRLRLFRLN